MTTKRILVPDSPAARRVAFLATCLADLASARDGFHIAMHLASSAERTERLLVRRLVADGIVTYWRSFATSNARTEWLIDLLELTTDQTELHELIRSIRNQLIAHSESERHQAYPQLELEQLEDGSVRIRGCQVTTTVADVPRALLPQLWEHSKQIHALVATLLDDAKQTLVAGITDDTARALWDGGEPVELVDVDVAEWTLGSRRKRYPKDGEITRYVDGVEALEENVPDVLEAMSLRPGRWKHTGPIHMS